MNLQVISIYKPGLNSETVRRQDHESSPNRASMKTYTRQIAGFAHLILLGTYGKQDSKVRFAMKLLELVICSRSRRLPNDTVEGGAGEGNDHGVPESGEGIR